ncbi:hypothetical protein [Dialister sp.]|uniref:hypothetical protein n=1 Tax=Dialister sp. TaxID=1955814 RepID=UPI003F0D27AE
MKNSQMNKNAKEKINENDLLYEKKFVYINNFLLPDQNGSRISTIINRSRNKRNGEIPFFHKMTANDYEIHGKIVSFKVAL